MPGPRLTDEEQDWAEVDAFTECVRAFLLFKPDKSYRIHVPWCENDYQIDVATEYGEAQYKRIVNTTSTLGIDHMFYIHKTDSTKFLFEFQVDRSIASCLHHALKATFR